MGVDLGLVSDTGGGDSERFDSPVKVLGPVGGLEGKTFSEGGLVDLDHADAAVLEVNNLVSEGKGDLEGGGGSWLIVSDE